MKADAGAPSYNLCMSERATIKIHPTITSVRIDY